MSPLPEPGWADPAALAQATAVLLLLIARMTPLAMLVPWLAPRAGAPLLGPLLALVLALALFPSAQASAPELPHALLSLTLLGVREVLVGTLYALSLALPLLALRWAGQYMDSARGLSPSELDASALAQLMLWLGIVAFFALGGHRLALAALAQGLTAHPVGLLTPAADPAALALGSARMLAEAFAAALLIALPVLAALLVASLALGLSVRLSNAAPLMTLLPVGRAALGLAMVWIAAALVLYRLPDALSQGLDAATRLWRFL